MSIVTTPTTSNSTKVSTKTKPSTPIGYKTLRDPPKSWNSQISKANISKTPQDVSLKNVKPAKFFKMRNNMPRFLGNPVNNKPKSSPSQSATLTSPKPAKPNLSFTPPNPYIPNLTSPTLDPNQFHFYPPQQHASLPAFDPRILNAYHNFWYGPRFGFGNPAAAMANLTLDLNQQQRGKAQAQTSHETPAPTKMTIATTTAQITSKLSLKKPNKEGTKSEKSLHTTVEKLLVQNRTKQNLNTKENNSEEGPSKTPNNKEEQKVVVEKEKSTSQSTVCSEKVKDEPKQKNNSNSDLKLSEKDTKKNISDKIEQNSVGESKNTV
ncbi:unnamed protein product [Brassicogethes aeneus]|uniref:Uncharacterized protein n=1 Tax=Brassicogethes aeneus TaxID=1431903 RepID=A0A9P0AX04_BRAAE|nr:unnamed protein product [Brassicogethes aeneus]